MLMGAVIYLIALVVQKIRDSKEARIAHQKFLEREEQRKRILAKGVCQNEEMYRRPWTGKYNEMW